MDSKLFNLKNTIMVVVFSVIAFIGFNSFIKTNAKENKTVLIAQAWYPLTPTSSSSYSSQIISGSPMSTLDPSGDCQTSNPGNFCAVTLKFEDEDTPPLLPANTTVQQAISLYGATVVFDGATPRYAKKP